MGKGMLRAALAFVLLGLWAGTTSAGVLVTPVMSDTLALYAADSSAAIDVSNASRLWLDIISVPVRPGDFALGDTTGMGSYLGHSATKAECYAYQCDSLNTLIRAAWLSFAVQAREVLTSAAGTDAAASAGNTRTAAAVSDSTVIPWCPTQSQTFAAKVDTFSVNGVLPGNAASGGTEITARIIPNAGNWTSRRSVRVEFVNPASGAPFRAQFASFRWRFLLGPAAGLVRLRVVLGRETW